MKFLKSLVISIHAILLLALGAVFVLLALNLLSSEQVVNAMARAYADPNVKIGLGIVGIIFILGGLWTAHANLGKLQMEKTIAFENPEGQVTVSLTAIEDFIKKSVRQLQEVKEMRSCVTANKKGINIKCRATIFDDSNIPETTERIQSIVKAKVHDMLGVEEAINMKIHVIKISSRGKGETIMPSKERPDASRRMPFSGVIE